MTSVPPPTPPHPPPKPPSGSGRGPSGASSLVGLLMGLFLCLGMPPLVFGLSLGALGGTGLESAWQIIVSLVLALAVPVGLFFLINHWLTQSTNPEAGDFRKTLRVAGFVSLALWGIFSIVVGLCIALLRSAY